MTFGSVPGPELVVTEGELVEVTLTNLDVEDGVTLHWHGYDVPSGDDGVAGVTQDAVAPGESFVYRFVADQVGNYWYHTHQDALEGIVRGLTAHSSCCPPIPRRRGRGRHGAHPHHGRDDADRRDDVLRVPEIGPPGSGSRTPIRPRAASCWTPTRSCSPSMAPISRSPRPFPPGRACGTRWRPRGSAGRRGTPVTLDVERGGSSGLMIGGDTAPGELSFRGPEFDMLDAASGPMPDGLTGRSTSRHPRCWTA